ncbi:MAG: hypothetical protein KDI50_03010, partial [Candidatus Competibacteraceae bacterium]|nr:hypothetical protein [Candidatus Competibacteraceae bacterium]
YLAWMNRHYQLDDALIYLRYVRNFLASPSFYSSWGVLAIMPSILWCEPPWHLGSGRGASCKDMPVI